MTEYLSHAFDSDCTTALQAVLVVDDNEDNLALMREILSEIDAEVLTASSGKQAIEIAMDRDDSPRCTNAGNGWVSNRSDSSTHHQQKYHPHYLCLRYKATRKETYL